MCVIIRASLDDKEIVRELTHRTISAVYPHYYPAGAVEFFIQYHSTENIIHDIESGNVWLITSDDGVPAGTVTINGNEINRLFVPPEHQGKGYGRKLIDFAEKLISQKYDTSELSSSLSAKLIYLKRGYTEVSYNIIETGSGDKLCYDYMVKHFGSKGGTE